MDQETRVNRVKALEAIKANALKMTEGGADANEVRDFINQRSEERREGNEVRDFINQGKMQLAYELPDLESAEKAFAAVARYKASQGLREG